MNGMFHARPSALCGFALAVFGLGLSETAVPAQNPASSRHSQASSSKSGNQEDNATFTFQINAKLPEFRFIVEFESGDPNLPDARPTVRSVTVFRSDKREPVQTLAGCDYSEASGGIQRDDNWLRAVDFDFDGYSDIHLINARARNWIGCIWLYNPAKDRFEFSQEFSNLGRLAIDSANKAIYSFEAGGPFGYLISKFLVQNHHLIEVMTRSHDFDEKKQRYECVVQELRNGEMVTIYDHWEDPDNNDIDPKCLMPVPIE